MARRGRRRCRQRRGIADLLEVHQVPLSRARGDLLHEARHQRSLLAPREDHVQVIGAESADELQPAEREAVIAPQHQRRDPDQPSLAPSGQNAQTTPPEMPPPTPLPLPGLEQRALGPLQQRVPVRLQRLELVRVCQLLDIVRFCHRGGHDSTLKRSASRDPVSARISVKDGRG